MFKKISVALMGFSPLLAMAAVDVTAITAVLPDIAIVGTAVFGVYVAIKATKFVRRAL